MILKSEQEIMKNWQGDFSKPIVSICSITYNHEKYISEAIDSFLMQETNFPFEIVIGEDCSTDGTRKIIEEYVEKYPNIIRLITSESNVGMNNNFIRTLNFCLGEYVAICEGDDYWTDPMKLVFQIKSMKENNVNISFHMASSLNTNVIEAPKEKYENRIYSPSELINADFHFVQTNTMIFVKEEFINLNIKFLQSVPILDIFIKIYTSKNTGALCLSNNMSIYRVQSDNSWTNKMKEETKFLKFVKEILYKIDEFDNILEYRFTKELHLYKIKFVKSILRKYKINIEDKRNLVQPFWSDLDIKSKVLYIIGTNRVLLPVFIYITKIRRQYVKTDTK